MHAIYKDPTCKRPSEMSELNAMDFVETEYKSDEPIDVDVAQNKPRRKSQRRPKVSAHYEYEMLDDDSYVNGSLSPKSNRKHLRKKRKKDLARSELTDKNGGNEKESCFPYAMLLKSLCDEVGNMSSAEELGRERLFKKLDYNNLCYPYATLLQELHDTAREDEGNIPQRNDNDSNCPFETARVSQVMKSFRFKTCELLGNETVQPVDDEREEFEVPFSTFLLDIILVHKLQGHSNVNDRTIGGVGEILKKCMAEKAGDRPAKELHSSALLQTLSHYVEKDNANIDTNEARKQVFIDLSGESSQDEEVEWKPSKWQPKGTPAEFVESDQSRQRKSQRKKRTITKFDATPETYKSLGPRNKPCKKSDIDSQSLLQLILGAGNDTHNEKETKIRKSKKSKVRVKVLEKIKDKINNRKSITDRERRENSFHNDLQSVEDYFRSEESLSEASGEDQLADRNVRVAMRRTREQRSLLKEYLLKPTDEDITSKGDCDIPTLSGNSFLFSRLLQNFKAVSDNRLTCSGLGGLEETSGSSILREMLRETCKPFPKRGSGSSDEMHDVKHFKPLEHLDLSSLHTFLSERNSLDNDNAFSAIKQEVEHEDNMMNGNVLREMLLRSCHNSELYPDIKDVTVGEHQHLSSLENCSSESDSLDNVNPVCKIKCEVKCEDEYIDDVHECNICHLQFSSGIDLANHEVLFHCNEESKTPSPACILPHTTEIIQKCLFQEKLPA